ncbi:MAG: FAD-dependent oxidoreductase [Actinobacteria bacterium]|nr:FAD-dependent oxidoreductase [Actinomycetota bacterium]
MNPETGQEDSRPDSPPDLTGLKVMVVGGGPAGLEAASRFARSGAQVTLAETETELGGRLRGAAVPQHKRPEYPRLLEFLIRSVERLDIDVQLGRTVDIDTVRNAGFDFVLLANGGEPTTPQPEDGRKYLAADLITNGSPPEGGSALVFGANQVGVDTALWLREYGIAVTIGDPGNEIASDVNILARDHLERLLGEAGVEIRLGTSLDDIDDGVSNLIVSEPTVPRYGRDLPEGVVAIGSAALPNANLRGATISALRALNRFSAVPSKLN